MHRRTGAAAVVLGLALGGAASAVTIADYQADFLAGTVNGQTRPARQADGWDYMWNSAGAIGTAANYTSLMWWSGQSHYNRDGAGNLPRSDPGAYVNLNAGGGHPGRGSTQTGGGNNIDRYAITAYTVQAGEGGVIQLSGSAIAVPSGGGNVEVRVYINNSFLSSLIRPGGGAASSFDRMLGWLSVGDKVFVAVGPNTTDGSDSFNLGYRLETSSDANVVVWDADGIAPINGGAGGWDTANARWVANSGSGGYVPWNNGSNYSALFPATGGNVTLDEPVTARSLLFSANGYTVSGANALTLTSAGAGGAGPACISVNQTAFTATISAPLLAATTITKVDAGTVVLQGGTTITGNLNAGGGNIVLAGNSANSVSGQVRVGLSPASSTLPNTFSGVLTIQDNATLNTPYIYMGENSGNVAGLTAVVNQTGGTVTLTGLDGEGNAIRIGHWPAETSTYNLSGGSLTTTNPTAEVALAIDGNGVFNLSGTGVLNTYRFVVNARNANGTGTLNVTGGTANIGAGGIVNESTGPAIVNLGGGTIRATAGFSCTLNTTLTGTNGQITFDTNSYNVTMSGLLGGAGGLTKVGDGTLTLANAGNNFTGPTSVQGGVLNSMGNLGSNLTIGPNGTLVAAQGVTRTLAVGGNYDQSGSLFIEIGGVTQGTLYDWVQVAGTATLGGVVDITITQPFAVTPGAYFDIVTAAAGITNLNLDGVGINIHGADLGFGLWSLLVPLSGNAEALRLVVSPEPSSLTLLALGALGLWRRRRARRQGR